MQGDPPSRTGETGGGGGWLPPEPAGPRPGVGQGPPAPAPQGPRSPSGDQPPPPGPPPGPGPAPTQPHGTYVPTYAQPGGGPGWQAPGQPEEGNGSAVAALVLGIVSLALLLVSAGLSTIVSLGCAIPAIFLGRKGRRLVDEGQTRKHRGLAQAGFIMGIVGTILSALATVFWVLIIVLSEDFQQGFEDGLEQDFDQSFDQSSAGRLTVRVAAPLARLLLG